MSQNVLIKIEYDGSDFSGWQKQPDKRTVQGEIEDVLKYIAMEDVPINGTSRTDAGVHALGQCATFIWDNPMPVDRLAMVMNRRFGAGGIGRSNAPGDIRIIAAEAVPDDFHARFSCVGKTYRYVINRTGNIYHRKYAYLLDEDLDWKEMQKAADHIVGTHDFACFQSSGGTPRETTVRTITALDIIDHGEELWIEVTGDGFLYNMVRIIVGTLVEVGLGKRSADEMPAVIESCDRAKAGFTALPGGLYLKEIYFDKEKMYENEL